MEHEIKRWIDFFQGLIFTHFRQDKAEAVEVLTWLLTGHLFGLYNLNQLADVLEIPKSSLYHHLSGWSLFQWKRLLLVIGCHRALELLEQTLSMSGATQSRRRITVGVDDTVQGRDGKLISYCYSWYSGRFHQVLKGQNILAVTLKVGDVVIPLCVRLVSKQGRANTSKPTLLIEMMSEIAAFFSQHGIAITDYPVTFDSWYGSQPLREALEQIGFQQILVHAKGSYVFTIDDHHHRLSVHKRTIELVENQWGCDCACARAKAKSPTFGKLILLFFASGTTIRCMMVFGKPLRSAEILSIWRQHHGIEQFWRNLKSIIHLSEMNLHRRDGAYASLGVKVLAYLMLTDVSRATGLTLHQITLKMSGNRALLAGVLSHFQPSTTTDA